MLCCCDTPPDPVGACCTSGGTCTENQTEVQCTNVGGVWQGEGTDCNPNPCPLDTQACCYTDGTPCEDTATVRCLGRGGTPQGAGTTCATVTCPDPTGACCQPDGTCTVETQTDCENAGHVWQGPGTTCDPNPCPIPQGVCCTTPPGPEECRENAQTECEQAGDVWLANRVCADVSCKCIQVVGGAVPDFLDVNFAIPQIDTDFRLSDSSLAQALDWLNGRRQIPLNPASGLGVCFYSVNLSWPDPEFDPGFPGYAVNLFIDLSFETDGGVIIGWLAAEVRLTNTWSLRYDQINRYRSDPENIPMNAFGVFTLPGTVPPNGNPNFESFINQCDGTCNLVLGQGSITTNAQ